MRVLPLALLVLAMACRRGAPGPQPAAPADPADQDPRRCSSPPTTPRFGDVRPESMWVSDLETVDGHLRGTLANQPVHLKAYKQGDPVIIKNERIVDWSYVKDGVLVGGYTLRVMFRRTPPAEREALQRDLGYRIQ